jgi:glycosyltransferase involved in cell wall biosynthesis
MFASQYDVTLITNANLEEISLLMAKNIKFIPLKVERKISAWKDFKALVSLYGIFRNEKFDAVHSLTPKAGLVSMLAAMMAGVPIRIHVFTGQVWVNKFGFMRNFLKLCDIIISFCSTNLLADSNSQRKFLIAQKISTLKKIKVLGEGSICGVDLNRFKPNFLMRLNFRLKLGIPKNAIVYLFIGRLNRDKGILDLVVAFKILANENADVHLLVVGPDEEGLYSQIDRMLVGCRSQLHCVGYSDKPENYMACADILCLPSYREGFGSVVIEAAAVGLPSIVSNIYGLQDAVINNQTGILHQPKNIDEMTAAMRVLGKDSRLRFRMAKLAKNRVKTSFSTSVLTNEMRHFYASLFRGDCG